MDPSVPERDTVLKLTSLIALLFVGACLFVEDGDDPPDPDVDRVIWNCLVAESCDGYSAEETQRICATRWEVDGDGDDFIDECRELLEPSCTISWSCSWECTPTLDECTVL